MPGRNFLFVPGPTNVPERILRAMDRAMEDHRSSAFPELAAGLLRDLRTVFKTTTGQAFIFPATGTGGWEAALQHPVAGRPDPRAPLRAVQPLVDRPGPTSWPARRHHRRRM